jgi:RNA polymerase-binding transcription factor DksA
MKTPEDYKAILEKERATLEEQLNKLGIQDPKDPANWDVKAAPIDIMRADENEAADKTEELHIDSIVLDELEIRYRNILRALEKIENGTFGVCEISGNQISEDRLDANPAARTCKEHLGEESTLPK